MLSEKPKKEERPKNLPFVIGWLSRPQEFHWTSHKSKSRILMYLRILGKIPEKYKIGQQKRINSSKL